MTTPWQRMRHTHLGTYPGCIVCGKTDNPVVHHLRYRGKRGESEKPGDLVTMCAFHHDDLHRSLRPGLSLVKHTLDYIEQMRFLDAALDAL